MNLSNIKKEFPIFNNKNLVYLDSANSSQKPQSVINRINDFYSNEFSNVGRSVHALSIAATNNYENTRVSVQKYINAKSKDEIVFTKGATEAINLVANTFGQKYLKEKIVIKCGGRVLLDPDLFNNFTNDVIILKKLGLTPIVVHGGGPRIKKKLDELNIETKFIMGLRVTDEKVIKIVEDVMIEFNKEIVDSLEKKSCKAKPITIRENNIIFSDDKGTIFNIDQDGKIKWKKNIYKKVYKKIYKNLVFSIYQNDIFVALDAKIVVEDNSLFRQPELILLKDSSQENDIELRASEHGLSYVSLSGDIALSLIHI